MAERVTEQTASTFNMVSSGAWLVDFRAYWCGPCRTLEPVLTQLAEERAETRIGLVDINDCTDLAARFGVSSVPTLILFRDGEPHSRLHGAKMKRQLERALDDMAGQR
jgi:thioredoxin 1